MAYHPLLDWRVARDLLAVLRHGWVTPNSNREEHAIASWASMRRDAQVMETAAPSCMFIIGQKQAALVVKHPLEAFDQNVASSRIAKTLDVLTAQGVEPERTVVADFHTVEMSPMVVKEAFAPLSRRS
ncbi:hypothetical protein [Frankia sp. Cr1]|uniref:hypothetical protein n=1 Tax=Frankia sp. Cr1 TaxID=3073931 RepID=UPI002AD57340|nr:hypothetical protein [Frankia sp. Cr1]